MRSNERTLVTGIFPDRTSAEKAYAAAVARGYTTDDLNLVMSNDTKKRLFSDTTVETELGSKAAEGAGVGGAVGGAMGAVAAAVAAVGSSVAVPGLGLVVAGPIAAALAGAGAGAATGGVVGALVGAAIPEEHVKIYDESIKKGGILMGVRPRSEADATFIEKTWRDNNAKDVFH